jgi:hypothetical protein
MASGRTDGHRWHNDHAGVNARVAGCLTGKSEGLFSRINCELTALI